MSDQRLDPTPLNYAFAYHVVTDPQGVLAGAVASLTDGGVRLTQRDIESLGVEISAERVAPANAAARDPAALAAQTETQVAGFIDIVETVQSEARDFGRDLAASVDAIGRSADGETIGFLDDVNQITATMIGRVHAAERRLDHAHKETQELRRMLEQARGDALRDPLTGLPNRRAFEAAFAQALAEGRSACIAICDVDHFKTVNDRFGHAVGDRVLRAIGQTLEQTCSGHLVARYGGEEFALLFYGPLDDGIATVDAARLEVARKRYRLRESDAPLGEITISAGVTPLTRDDRAADAFQRADRLLYAAKDAGRNQVLTDSNLRD
ncbi:GGDEF domain-containing protein [Sphingomonas qomolangmaensis]|uniref:diguanylate cyclase n=1 Tax=Sphingomonas qomolangmaensis TaxID=2918765 RepID=A0ABY5LAF7_9SPHN|nr:GGDEF domain-containing protein [Sphingomonas qomolangmaensis]UUL82608.1 GGDEF domain-containing protein [Sphingomonas qomolangmaensis]